MLRNFEFETPEKVISLLNPTLHRPIKLECYDGIYTLSSGAIMYVCSEILDGFFFAYFDEGLGKGQAEKMMRKTITRLPSERLNHYRLSDVQNIELEVFLDPESGGVFLKGYPGATYSIKETALRLGSFPIPHSYQGINLLDIYLESKNSNLVTK